MKRTTVRLILLAAVLVCTSSATVTALLGAGQANAAETAVRNDRWTEAEMRVLESMTLAKLPSPPPDPSNAVEARSEAIALGRSLFSDARFSANGKVSCASCHDPVRQFQDGLPVGKGIGAGSRRTMAIAGAAYSPWLFWDGRKDSLWSQALGPLEDAAEHGGNRLELVRVLLRHYMPEYESVFGRAPELSGLPDAASPLGDSVQRAGWEAIPAPRQEDINRAFANLGKAIAAYERSVQYGHSRFDQYAHAVLAGDRNLQALSPQEVNGLRLFIGKGQCSTCHNGPLLTDQAFHNTGIPPRLSGRPDRGRASATAKVLNDEFNCLGRYSDARPETCAELQFMSTDDPALFGAFKTPSLRNVALRPPYMHGGQLASLEEVVGHYARSPAAAVGQSELAHAGNGHAERGRIRLSQNEVEDLVAFMRSLSGPLEERTGG